MNLTSALHDRNSPISRFVRFVGTMADGARRGEPFAQLPRQVLGLEAMPSKPVVEPVLGANAGTVGTAFDYRMRYHLANADSSTFLARHAIPTLSGRDPGGMVGCQLDWFFANLDELVTRLSPAGRRLDDADEALLCRYCIVLAYFEAVYRSGPGGWRPTLPPPAAQRAAPESEGLLTLAPEPAVKDMTNLSRSAETTFAPFIGLAASGRVTCRLNPRFAGSVDIPADADFVLGDLLFDLKTTKTLDAKAVREAVLQLIAYVLLDYDDEYHIRQIGLYAARHEWVICWPLWEFVLPPASVLRLHSAGIEPDAAQVDSRLAKLRALMKLVVTDHEIDYGTDFSDD